MQHMRTLVPVLALLALARGGFGQEALIPEGWYRAGPPEALPIYRVTLDSTIQVGGRRSLRLEFSGSGEPPYGTVIAQSIRADDFRGSRVRLRGYARSDRISVWAGLWMRVDGSAEGTAFDNMSDRSIRGSTEWRAYEVVLDVPADASSITFGAIFNGTGVLWLDEFDLAVAEDGVRTTGGLRTPQATGPDPAELPFRPHNLGFELQGGGPVFLERGEDATEVG